MTPIYLGSEEEQVMDTQDQSIERTRGRALRIIEREELSTKVMEEKNQAVTNLNEYKIMNKHL